MVKPTALIAQWQSARLVSSRSGVRTSLSASFCCACPQLNRCCSGAVRRRCMGVMLKFCSSRKHVCENYFPIHFHFSIKAPLNLAINLSLSINLYRSNQRKSSLRASTPTGDRLERLLGVDEKRFSRMPQRTTTRARRPDELAPEL